jgi:hypothetical protein
MSFKQKYFKYKEKYLNLKNQIGGGDKLINAIYQINVKLVRKKLTGDLTISEKLLGLQNIKKKSNPNSIDKKTGNNAIILAYNLYIKYYNKNFEFRGDYLPHIIEIIRLLIIMHGDTSACAACFVGVVVQIHYNSHSM